MKENVRVAPGSGWRWWEWKEERKRWSKARLRKRSGKSGPTTYLPGKVETVKAPPPSTYFPSCWRRIFLLHARIHAQEARPARFSAVNPAECCEKKRETFSLSFSSVLSESLNSIPSLCIEMKTLSIPLNCRRYFVVNGGKSNVIVRCVNRWENLDKISGYNKGWERKYKIGEQTFERCLNV